ncbi:MAG: hypothetical protein MUF87_22200 [Anaerolineae bacterium]|jgi:hypothetical protein|nr:hypothetical protein [Anaerolineae bacterium]
MQISRHWRLNAQRYRLEGVRTQTGATLQERPMITTTASQEMRAVVSNMHKKA